MNHYQTLQVDRAASQEVIEAAYRRLAKMFHPDVNSSPDANQKMLAINEAYNVLRDPSKRAAYDYALAAAESASSSSADRYASAGTSAEQQRDDGESGSNQYDYSNSDPGFPVHCMGCGRSDASLRLAAFPYVVSVVLVTFRRSWGGVYCQDCRHKESAKAKFISFLFGWWGIPFGFFYTLGTLFGSNEGIVPPRENAAYLRALGIWFIGNRENVEAESALSASLGYEWDEVTAQIHRKVAGPKPAPNAKPQSERAGKSTFQSVVILVSAFTISVAILGGVAVLAESLTQGNSVIAIAAVSTPQAPALTQASISERTPAAPLQPTPFEVPRGPWKTYTNSEIGFTAHIPQRYEAAVSEPPDKGSSSSVVFRDSAAKPPYSPVIGTYSYTAELSEADMLAYLKDMLGSYSVVEPPALKSINGYPAVTATFEDFTSDRTKVRVMVALIQGETRLYSIAVWDLADKVKEIEWYFDNYVARFKVQND